jgi:hypothetical protein
VILAAAVLILLGLGLFVAGVMTGEEVFYWGCVAACLVAAVLLFLARKQQPGSRAAGPPAGTPKADDRPVEAPTTGSTATTATGPSAEAEPAPAGTGEHRIAAAAPATHAVAEPGAHGGRHGVHDLPDPPIEEVEVTDLLLVVDLTDEVLVLDERPRYHLPGCAHLRGHAPIPLPIDEARTDGFTPCAVCAPDRTLAERVRARKAGRG